MTALAKEIVISKCNHDNYEHTEALKKDELSVKVKELVNTLRKSNLKANKYSKEKIEYFEYRKTECRSLINVIKNNILLSANEMKPKSKELKDRKKN